MGGGGEGEFGVCLCCVYFLVPGVGCISVISWFDVAAPTLTSGCV